MKPLPLGGALSVGTNQTRICHLYSKISRDGWVNRISSWPIMILSHRFKTEHKVLADLTCGKILLMNDVILVVTLKS